jgi:hypothetical protein
MSDYENIKQRVLNAYTVLGGGLASTDVILRDSRWMLEEIQRLRIALRDCLESVEIVGADSRIMEIVWEALGDE